MEVFVTYNREKRKIVQDDNEEQVSKRQKYSDNFFKNTFKDSVVKKLLMLGIVQYTQENYKNVSELWKILDINKFLGTIATDLKLANIMLGIIRSASLYPCT